ncbi:MAG: ATP-binding protein [Lachnospiraceae bacterium]|nr:ATP-binding protein [Lachnospiraceae bacterium]
MLSQFTVKNYKSIRDEITLDMQAAAISEHENEIIKIVDKESKDVIESFLPVSVIYGPNGGGKSNVLEALHTLEAKVLRPVCATCPGNDCGYKGKKIPVKPFLFSNKTKNEPTEFEIFFRTDIAEYRYILHIKEENVVYESLDRVKLETGRRSALFKREGDTIDLKGEFSRIRISDEISDTLPLLSYLGITYKKNMIVSDVFSWFEKDIDFLNYGSPLQEMRTAIAKSDDLKQLILKMIKEMNLDIDDFRVEEKDDNLEVYMKHNVDGYTEEISLSDESSGTQKIFGLLPFIAKSLVFGTTLIIDELDAKIHPLLLRYIIELYTSPISNKKMGQLVFTSHDLSTMNSEVFRRDEIWFVAKGNQQNSKLYSLVEFKNKNGKSVRKDAKFDKQYLEGKYGADPYLRKIIDWSDVNA